MNEVGCFGKIPAHGDFIWQALPARFVTPWDNWIQGQMLELKKQHPNNWLETYLSGPIWRFLIQDEALGSSTWCGIIVPSVDLVGRYFPLTIATALPRFCSVAESLGLVTPWLLHAEEVALQALEKSLSVEKIMSRVRECQLPQLSERKSPDTDNATIGWSGFVREGEFWSEQLLDQIIYNAFEKPCHWSCLDTNSATLRFLITEGFSVFNGLFSTRE